MWTAHNVSKPTTTLFKQINALKGIFRFCAASITSDVNAWRQSSVDKQCYVTNQQYTKLKMYQKLPSYTMW